MTSTLQTQQSMHKKKKKKVKRKLRKLTSIMPMLEWRPDLSQIHMFRMPFRVGGMKDLQLHTPIKSRKKKVWANVYQKLSYLPHDIYMKNIKFGFIPKDNYMGWNVDKHKIVWIDQQVQIPINEIISLAFKGTAITYTEWTKTYNPYIKYSKFIIDTLKNNKRVQTSLPYLMQSYRDNGVWEEIRMTIKEISNVATFDTAMDMWHYFSGGHIKDAITMNQFTVPNPISSARITLEEIPYFSFLLTKNTMKRHQLQEHISSAPKSLAQEQKVDKILDLTPEQQRSYDDLPFGYEERRARELIAESDRLLAEEEDNPF